MNGGNSGGESGRATPEGSRAPSLAGGLAEALRARQASMQGKPRDDDDDWELRCVALVSANADLGREGASVAVYTVWGFQLGIESVMRASLARNRK